MPSDSRVIKNKLRTCLAQTIVGTVWVFSRTLAYYMRILSSCVDKTWMQRTKISNFSVILAQPLPSKYFTLGKFGKTHGSPTNNKPSPNWSWILTTAMINHSSQIIKVLWGINIPLLQVIRIFESHLDHNQRILKPAFLEQSRLIHPSVNKLDTKKKKHKASDNKLLIWYSPFPFPLYCSGKKKIINLIPDVPLPIIYLVWQRIAILLTNICKWWWCCSPN